jgi:hypothetical protein
MQEELPFSFKSTPWFQSTFLNLMIMGRRPEKLHVFAAIAVSNT